MAGPQRAGPDDAHRGDQRPLPDLREPARWSASTPRSRSTSSRRRTPRGCAGRIYSGLGGQADFVVGAIHSPGGQALIGLRSWHPRADISTIVPLVPAPVTSFQMSAVITEQGTADILGHDQERQAANLISQAAHPDARDDLWRRPNGSVLSDSEASLARVRRQPAPRARDISTCRVRAPAFSSTAFTWSLTVCSESTSRSATSWRGQPVAEQGEHLGLARREPVHAGEQVGALGRRTRLDGHRDVALALLRADVSAIRSAFTVTQRLPPRWTRAHGSPTGTPCSAATSAAATLYAAAGIGVIGSSGGFSWSRAAAAPAVCERTWRSGSSTTTAGPTGSSWSGVSTKVRASADRSPGTTYGASAPRYRSSAASERAVGSPQLEQPPAPVTVTERRDGDVGHAELTLYLLPEP